MTVLPGKSKLRESSISAVVTRADGTVEDLGIVSYWHKSPIKRLAWRVRQWLQKS